MTKIAFWKMYLLFNDADRFCNSLSCKNQCPYYKNCDDIVLDKLNAEAYIKRHEGKSKRTVKENLEVAPIQCCKCIGFETCKRKERELSILHFCDGYVSNESMMYIHTVDPNEKVKPVYVTCINNRNTHTPLTIGKKYEVVGEGKGHYTIQDDIGTLCCMQKDRFDDGKEKASEPVGNTDKLVEPVIEPIKFDDPVPEYVYKVTSFGIFEYICVQFNECFNKEFGKSISRTFSVLVKQVDGEAKWDSNTENYYSTPEKAFTVFMKARRK